MTWILLTALALAAPAKPTLKELELTCIIEIKKLHDKTKQKLTADSFCKLAPNVAIEIGDVQFNCQRVCKR